MSFETLIKVAPETSVARLNDERREGRTLYDTSQMRLMPHKPIPLVVDHDLSRQLGRVSQLMRLQDVDGYWIFAVAELDKCPAWLKRGTRASFQYYPLATDSFGHNIVRSGLISEVSVLKELEPYEPSAAVVYVKPKVEKPPAVVRAAAAPIAYSPPRISLHSETEELRRRQAWLGDDVPLELILENMQRELAAVRRRLNASANRRNKPFSSHRGTVTLALGFLSPMGADGG